MTKLSIPRDALVFVGDGQKALFLRNAGDSTLPNFTTVRVLTDTNLPTHEQGTDRPGRVFKRAGTNRRSGVETMGCAIGCASVASAGALAISGVGAIAGRVTGDPVWTDASA